jgi:integrase/recombinase XerD
MEVDRMNASQGSQEAVGLNQGSRFKDYLRGFLDPYEKDLKLRGLTRSSQLDILGCLRRYLIWAAERGLDPRNAKRDDLLTYLGDLRARRLKQCSLVNNFSSLSGWFTFLTEQEEIVQNPIPAIQKRYLNAYKDETRQRQIISVEEAAKMVRATIDSRDRAILLLLFKTGIRRGELATLDLDSVNLEKQYLILKPTGKRSNRMVFFDDEAARALARWIKASEKRLRKKGDKSLFLNNHGQRLSSPGINTVVREAAIKVGLHEHESDRLEDKFTPHCCRHWLVTHLLRAGMPRDQVKWIRGDVMHEAIDLYNHIDPEDVKRNYLACIPKFGV